MSTTAKQNTNNVTVKRETIHNILDYNKFV